MKVIDFSDVAAKSRTTSVSLWPSGVPMPHAPSYQTTSSRSDSFLSMTDVTTSVNELLKGYNTGSIRHPNFSLEHIGAFIKEAYQIVSHS